MYGATKFELPRLRNWGSAVAHEARVVPIRGRHPECKPISKRRNTHVSIRKESDNSIACRLYRTDVVTYREDGRIEVRLDGWVSNSTVRFIAELLGTSVYIAHRRAWIDASVKGSSGIGAYALHAHRPNVFLSDERGNLVFQNPAPVQVHRVNRKRTNNVRKLYEPFKDYIVRVMRLRDDGFSNEEFGEVFGWSFNKELPNFPPHLEVDGSMVLLRREGRGLLELARSTEVIDQYKASLWLARSCAYMQRGRWRPPLSKLLKLLDDLILLDHREECFDEAPVVDGRVTRDAYARFFGRGND